MSHRGQLVEAGKQLVQGHDQLLGRALRCQAGEALDVGKQYAAGHEMLKGVVRGRKGRDTSKIGVERNREEQKKWDNQSISK